MNQQEQNFATLQSTAENQGRIPLIRNQGYRRVIPRQTTDTILTDDQVSESLLRVLVYSGN